ALIGVGAMAKGPVAPALFAAAIGLFLLWQRDLRRVFRLCTPSGVAAFLVLALGWYALAAGGWGPAVVQEHLIRRYGRTPGGGGAGGSSTSICSAAVYQTGREGWRAATPTRRSPGTTISSSIPSISPPSSGP